MTRARPRASSIRAAASLVALSDVEIVRSGLATVNEAAGYLRCSRATIYRYFNEGLPFFQHGNKRRVPWTALYSFAAAGMIRRDRTVAS